MKLLYSATEEGRGGHKPATSQELTLALPSEGLLGGCAGSKRTVGPGLLEVHFKILSAFVYDWTFS